MVAGVSGTFFSRPSNACLTEQICFFFLLALYMADLTLQVYFIQFSTYNYCDRES